MAKSNERLHYAILWSACKSLANLSRWSPIYARRVRGHRDAAGDRTQLTYADSGANALAVQYGYSNAATRSIEVTYFQHSRQFLDHKAIPDHVDLGKLLNDGNERFRNCEGCRRWCALGQAYR